ncbi:MAG TPA: hypothetical protein VGN05_16390 [Parvibaculum sp.]
MDDSIYRDFYWARDQIELWWAMAWPHLTSDVAMRLYVVVAALAILVGSIYLAYRMMSELRKIELGEFAFRQRGRKPRTQKSIDTLRERIKEFRARRWRFFLTRLAALLVFGFIIPSTGLYLSGAYYDWFDATHHAFVAIHGGDVVAAPRPMILLAFVFNQLSHGTMMDFLEVFHVDFGQVVNNPDNYAFSLAVFLYRSFVGTFAVVLLFFIRRATLILWRLEPIENLLPAPRTAAIPAT